MIEKLINEFHINNSDLIENKIHQYLLTNKINFKNLSSEGRRSYSKYFDLCLSSC